MDAAEGPLSASSLMMESLMACGAGLTIPQGKEHNAAWAAICVSMVGSVWQFAADGRPMVSNQGKKSRLQQLRCRFMMSPGRACFTRPQSWNTFASLPIRQGAFAFESRNLYCLRNRSLGG